MIYSKAALSAVDIVKSDKSIPALDNVHFRADGGVVAANGSCVIAVSPLSGGRRSKVPLTETKMIGDGETVASETVREVVKGMPRDSLFAGTLENCDYSSGKFTLTDGKRHRTIVGRTFPRPYIDYAGIFKRVGKATVEKRVAINLRRLADLIAVIDKMFPDSSNNSAVYLEFTSENDVVVRARDIRGGEQTAVGVIRSYVGAEAKWPETSEWEKKLFTSAEGICDSKASVSVPTARKINKQLRARGA